mgnify:CR=1 FL=1
MEFVKITFPTKEDIASTIYDSVAAAMGTDMVTDVVTDGGPAPSLYEIAGSLVPSLDSLPTLPLPTLSLPLPTLPTLSLPTTMPQMGKIPLEEWSAPPPASDNP